MSDEPIAHRRDGSPIYDNTPSVVVLALYKNNPREIITILRATEPGAGLYALPGGYQMRGEKWQEAGCREVAEELGIDIDPKDVKLITIISDSYNNNVIFGAVHVPEITNEDITINSEVLSAGFMDKKDIELSNGLWAFPTHALIADFMIRESTYA